MTNIRYVRDNYLFKINNRSDNFRMHLAGNRCPTTANLEAGDGLWVMADGQGKQFCYSRSNLFACKL